MSSIVRRAGAKLLRMIERAADPGAEADRILVYGKDSSGVTQLFAQASDGTVYQITPSTANAFLPEAWEEQDVAANLTNEVVAADVSTLFDTVVAVRAGSLTGLTTQLTEAVTAGTLTVKVSINGVSSALTLTHTSVLNPTGGRATAAIGAIPFVAGDLIGILIDTTAGFLPNSTDLMARVEVRT